MTSTRFISATTGALLVVSLTCSAAIATPSVQAGLSKAELAKVKGEVGIAMVDMTRNKQYMLNQSKLFPMQSVCKLPISIAVLRLADEGKLSVQEKMTIRKADVLKSLRSPIKDAIKAGQTEFTIRELLTRTICDSDNTTSDLLIKRAGGTGEISRVLTEAGIKGVRVDRSESIMQPDSMKISRFLKDPRDTAAPESMIGLLQRLYSGSLLSKESTALILEDLFNCRTGLTRLKAGLPKGWKLAHKTGTGADVSGQNAGTNDVGVIVGPKGQTIYIAVFTKGSRAKLKVREALMAKIASRAIAGTL